MCTLSIIFIYGSIESIQCQSRASSISRTIILPSGPVSSIVRISTRTICTKDHSRPAPRPFNVFDQITNQLLTYLDTVDTYLLAAHPNCHTIRRLNALYHLWYFHSFRSQQKMGSTYRMLLHPHRQKQPVHEHSIQFKLMINDEHTITMTYWCILYFLYSLLVVNLPISTIYILN